MVDFSESPNLYYAIGAGAVVLLLLVCCCCCCCRRRKNAKTKSPINSPVPYSVQHQVVDVRENEREYTMINETSPRESQKQIQNPVKPKSFSAKHLSPTVPSPSFSTAMTDSAGHTNTPQKQPPAEAAAPMEPSVPIEPTVPKPSGSSRAVVTTASILEDELIVASRLPFDTITALVLISKGGFGEVYKGSYRGNIVAIKRLLPESKRDMKQINAFLQEVKLMASLDHAHIVKFIGVAWDALSDVSVITEFMEGGDLRSVLNHFDQVQGRPLGFDKQKASIALHVAHALTYMHSLQPVVLHRDLKSKNILLDATQSVAKLTDFGVSRERSDRTMTAAVGTILWMAPEVMSGDHYDEKADVFSFGVVLSELDTYSMPYADVKARMVSESGRPLPDTALLQRIMTGRVTVSFSPELRSDVRALGQACVSVDPKMRPTAAQVLYELQKIERTMASEITFVL